ncbi:MAG: thiamine pyrophosphate-dependent enzyme [Desulfatirhabdiaceae bacterium]
METPLLMLGNQAIARGLAEAGCQIATSYPGTPASEILTSLAVLHRETGLPVHTQWAINEKVAFEIAYAGAMTGLRTAVSMKQVGLNVASDPLMSAAYMGTIGGFVIISADDPGPHSSQTEQDSRMMAMMAKIPVLDPASPGQAMEMAGLAFDLSEEFEIPVMLRPTTRVCHARQDIVPHPVPATIRQPQFKRNPARWAATPKFRLVLHQELEKKLEAIGQHPRTAPLRLNPDAIGKIALVASGVLAVHAEEILKDLSCFQSIPLYQVRQPYPLHPEFMDHLSQTYETVMVLEETTPVIEMQLADRHHVQGKLTGHVSRTGEILPEAVEILIRQIAGMDVPSIEIAAAPGRRPTLCAGCPHRASFYAIKKAAPKGIYTSDIGCYTLGLNLGAVDTVLCMGAAISQAAGFYHAYRQAEKQPDIIATIGDSTFFHAGLPALVDAVVQKVQFVLVILDNATTAMTGNQPTPATGSGAIGDPLNPVCLEQAVAGCGVKSCTVCDPYQVKDMIQTVKTAMAWSKNNGPAVVIARRPCVLYSRNDTTGTDRLNMVITDACDGCGVCVKQFECPALILEADAKQVNIDQTLCTGCGVCVSVCPKQAIETRTVPQEAK